MSKITSILTFCLLNMVLTGLSIGGKPQAFQPGSGGNPLRGNRDVLWLDNPDFSANTGSSEIIGDFGLETEIANDLILEEQATIRKVTWWGSYWNGFDGTVTGSGFNLRFYHDAGCLPEVNPFMEYILTGDVCCERLDPSGDWFSQFKYQLCLDLPLDAGLYWFSAQMADHEFIAQWGRLGADVTQSCESAFRSEYFAYPEWVPASDVFGDLYDASQMFEDDCEIECDRMRWQESTCTLCQNQPGAVPDSDGSNNCGGDDSSKEPVYLFSGEFYLSATDVRIQGLGMDFLWGRKYRSRLGPSTRQGNGWDSSYDLRIEREGPDLVLFDGHTRQDTYRPQTDSTWTAAGFFRVITRKGDGSYTLTFSDTGTWNFHPFNGLPQEGKIETIVDRNGHVLRFEYDAEGRLDEVTDTLGRPISMTYNADGFVESVTDFVGREVRYEYYQDGDAGGSFGDLKSVTTPGVDSTETFPIPPGHEFPNGKTTTYTYTVGFDDPRLNHNLLTITDPKGQTYLTNIYATTEVPTDYDYDRVVAQILGGPDDRIDFCYVPLVPNAENHYACTKTIVNDRVGNVQEYFFNAQNQTVMIHEFTGRADPGQPTTEVLNRPSSKLRASDPDSFVTCWEYNADGLATRAVYPNGNWERFQYDEGNEDFRSRNNLLRHCSFPGPLGGDQDSICVSYEYADSFGGCCGSNFVTRVVDAKGNITRHSYDDHGNCVQTQYPILSIVEDFEYDSLGRVIRRIYPDNGSGVRRQDVYNYDPITGFLMEQISDEGHLALTQRYEYDAVGNRITVIDPQGHDIRYIYNQLNQIVREFSAEVVDGDGTRYVQDTYYDANDNLVRIDTPNVDETGQARPNGTVTTTYDYEILNHIIRETYEADSLRNVVMEHEYDAKRNRILTRYGEATAGDQDPETVGLQPENTVSFQYDERDLVYHRILGAGSEVQSSTQYDYDGNRNETRQLWGLEDEPREYREYYDGYSRLVTEIDPMGNETVRHYDPNGNLLSLRWDGQLVDIEGNAGNIRLAEICYEYDPMDRLVREDIAFFETETQAPISDGMSTTEIEYTDNSQIRRIVDDNGNERVTTYDTANRTETTIDAAGNTVTRIYDANSNVIQVNEVETSQLGAPRELFVPTFTYDNLDRLVEVVDNGGGVTEYGYDSWGNLTLWTDALGNRIRYEYDGLNRLLATSRILTDDGLGTGLPVDTLVTRMEWDDTSRLVRQVDDNGNATRYEYDPLNRLTKRVHADSTIHSFTYDVRDNETSRVDANGTRVMSWYDLNDRLTLRTVEPAGGVLGTSMETYGYDGLSRFVSAVDDDSEVNRKYDSLSRMTWETATALGKKQGGPVRFARREVYPVICGYDGIGNLLSCTYPSEFGLEITWNYDELHRVKTIADEDGLIATYSYIGPGRIELREYPKVVPHHTIRTTYSYDWLKRIIGTTHTRDPNGAGEVVDARTYDWDAVGNKTERVDIRAEGERLTQRYDYDSTYRLRRSLITDAAGALLREVDYQLDGVGNRIVVTGDNCAGIYSMDPALPEPADFQVNQYTTIPCAFREYDKNGNLVLIDRGLPTERNLSYDYRNQMVQHTDVGSGVTTTYGYDALGRRFERVVDAGTPHVTRFAYLRWQIVEEQDEDGNTEASYVYGSYIDEALRMRRGDVDYFYHTDDLYDVVAVTDVSGSVVERYDYADYGAPQDPATLAAIRGDPSAIGNPYLFTGRRYDPETGWYHFRTRYLDPSAGRFTTRDPIGVWADQANMGNGYTYLGNNPMGGTDPIGLLIKIGGKEITPDSKLYKEIASTSAFAGEVLDAQHKSVGLKRISLKPEKYEPSAKAVVHAYKTKKELMDEIRLRQAMVDAAREFHDLGKKFCSKAMAKCENCEHLEGAKPPPERVKKDHPKKELGPGIEVNEGSTPTEAINEIFSKKSKVEFGCAAAQMVIMLRAMSKYLNDAKKFDEFFKNGFPERWIGMWEYGQGKGGGGFYGAPYAHPIPGDMRKFYSKAGEGTCWEYENTTYLGKNAKGEGEYFGQGMGILTKAGMEAGLEAKEMLNGMKVKAPTK